LKTHNANASLGNHSNGLPKNKKKSPSKFDELYLSRKLKDFFQTNT